MTHIGIDHCVEGVGLHLFDLGHLVHAARDHKDVEPPECLDGLRDQISASRLAVGARIDLCGLALAAACYLSHGIGIPCSQSDLAARSRERFCGNRAKGTRGARDQCHLARNIEERVWIRQAHFGRPPSG